MIQWAAARVSSVLGMLALAAASGCGSHDAATTATYTFDPQHVSVQVDTKSLRQAKSRAGIAGCPASDLEATAREGGLPAVTLPCLGGGRDVNLAGLGGRPRVINFWAPYCGPCRAEAPLFERLHERAGRQVQVLGVDWQDTRPAGAIDFASGLGLAYPQLADPEAATRAPMRISALPITFFVRSDGGIAHVEYGPVRSEAELAALVRDHLGLEVSRR